MMTYRVVYGEDAKEAYKQVKGRRDAAAERDRMVDHSKLERLERRRKRAEARAAAKAKTLAGSVDSASQGRDRPLLPRRRGS